MRRAHHCETCTCMTDECPECGHLAPDHDEPMTLDLRHWCSRSPTRRAVIADEKARGVYKREEWVTADDETAPHPEG